MRTVSDLMRADAALLVSCRNCAREGTISARLLRERFGPYQSLDDLAWRCVGCDGRNVRVTIGAASLAAFPERRYRGLF